jgi:hypothetical protein
MNVGRSRVKLTFESMASDYFLGEEGAKADITLLKIFFNHLLICASLYLAVAAESIWSVTSAK